VCIQVPLPAALPSWNELYHQMDDSQSDMEEMKKRKFFSPCLHLNHSYLVFQPVA
jgi:hypothetical protein